MSTTKSITGILVGMLIDDGRIPSIDEPVCTYVQEWCDGIRGAVTVGHLLSMTSGLPRYTDRSVGFVGDKNAFVIGLTPENPPGATWAYSNEGAQLLSPVLDRAAGRPIQDYARDRLFEPLGMKDTRLNLDQQRHAWTYADMQTTPRDLLRIGELMLNRGRIGSRQVVSRKWVEASTTASQVLNDRYGLLWWLLPEIDGFAALGHLDTDVLVVPSRRLIIVRMQSKPAPGVAEGMYLREVLKLIPALAPIR
jgi:CubicO group peptidase (beta-lactamase class C family)